MKKIYVIGLLLLLFYILLMYFTDKEGMLEVYKDEALPSSASGRITNMELYGGVGLTLTITDSLHKTELIPVDGDFNAFLKKNDYFIKIKNSNQCIVKRNDSVILLNCLKIDKKYRDSLGKIKEWPNSMKDRWMIVKGNVDTIRLEN